MLFRYFIFTYIFDEKEEHLKTSWTSAAIIRKYVQSQAYETKLGCFGDHWQVLEDFKQHVRKYSTTGEEVDRVIELFLEKKKRESLGFLTNIDKSPYLERSELRPYCTQVHQRFEGLMYSFKAALVKLETPLISIRLEIKDRLSDIVSAIDVYQKMADNKHQHCSPGYRYCQDLIVKWLKENVDKMQCRVTANCFQKKNHTLVQRSVSNCEEFKCSSGECITYDKVCNGETDCSDKKDETPNCTRYCFDGFHCRDLRCIEKMQVCDGTPNCEDGSDEENCKQPAVVHSAANCNLETGGFLCSNKHCVTLVQICDGRDDCGDGSDEGPKCNETVCSAGCTASGGVCSPGPKGALCLNECPDGMADDRGKCRAGPRRALENLEGLFEQVPYLLERYVGAMWLLKKRFISGLEKALISCLPRSASELSSLRQVVRSSQ